MTNKVLNLVIIILCILIIGIVVNLLIIYNYDFKLIGSENIVLNLGDTWEDPGYEIKNKTVNVSNNIDYSNTGDYTVTYAFRLGLVTRSVYRYIKIVDANQDTGFTLKLKGKNPYYLLKNNQYKEAGYEVNDTNDGDLTSRVEVKDNIKSDTLGTYEVTYKVKNSDGIIKTTIRKVNVYSFNFTNSLTTTEFTQVNNILLTINDSNYDYTILPNNDKTTDTNVSYEVKANGKYIFKIYDKNNNYLTYEENITNIDTEKPTGNCTLSLLNKGGKITVNAKDNGKIKGYEYVYGSTKSNLVKENNYNINTMDDTANVIVYDLANNNTSIKCSVIDNSTKHAREYTLETFNQNGFNKKYWLYKPNITERQKVPLLIYFHGAGGSASVNAVNNIAIPKNLKDGKDFPYYVAAPYQGTNHDFAMSLLKYLVNTYHVDSKRVYISGGSAGSPAALSIAGQHPNRFAGIVIIAGYGNTVNTDVNKVTYLPVWFHQGSYDSFNTMKNYVDRINSAGGHAVITSYPGGHDAPVDAFLKTEVTNWILSNKSKLDFNS